MASNDTLRSACFVIVGVALALTSGISASRAQGHGFGAPNLPHGIGAHGGGGRGGIGRARVAVYDVVTVSNVTDAAGLKTTLTKLGPSLTGMGGRVLVDTDDPTAVKGMTPSHLAIVVFDDVFSAGSWQKSPAFKALSDELAKEGTLQVAAVGGIADPGAPPAVPMASLGPAPGRNRLPEIPKIADICKGC
jgi:uncharacterized protein (DUF1330 family)